MIICTSRCHTGELPAIFQCNIYLQSGHAKSVCQYNVDISIHCFISDGKFHKAGTCAASPLFALFTDHGFAAALRCGSKACNSPQPPMIEYMGCMSKANNQDITESAKTESQLRRRSDSLLQAEDTIDTDRPDGILEQNHPSTVKWKCMPWSDVSVRPHLTHEH